MAGMQWYLDRIISASATKCMFSNNVNSDHFILNTRFETASSYCYYPLLSKPISPFNLYQTTKILESSKLKEFADDNFKFDENERKLSKQIENTVEKGEIARYEQFLLFPQCFQKACFPGASKGVIVWEWVMSNICVVCKCFKFGTGTCIRFCHLVESCPFPPYILIFNASKKKALGKHCGKRWNWSEWAISPFSAIFSMQSVS